MLCEGRPNEPCPEKAQGFPSQGELILCTSCEEFRFPYIKAARSNRTKQEYGVKTRSCSSSAKNTGSANSVNKPCTDTSTSKTQTTETTDTEYTSVDTYRGCSAGNCSVASKPTDLKCDVCSRMFHGYCLGF